MNYIILFLLIFLLIVGWLNSRNKGLCYVIMLIFFILVCFSYDSYDYVNYLTRYNLIGSGQSFGYEPLFELLIRIGNRLHLNFNQFRIIITFFEIIIINSTIKRYCGDNAFVWSMFLVFPGWLLVTLFRFTMGFSLVVYGIRYLIEDGEYEKVNNLSKKDIMKSFLKNNSFKYCFCVAIAASIHNSFWVLLILVLVKKLSTKSLFIISIIIVGTVWVTSATGVLRTVALLLSIREDYINMILSGNYRNINGLLYSTLRQSLIMGFAWIVVRNYRYGRCNLEDKFMKMLIPINCIGISILATAYFTSNTRLCHIIILINFIGCGICINSRHGRTMTTFLLKLFTLIFCIGFSYLMCTMESRDAFNLVLKMIFETNEVINFFE